MALQSLKAITCQHNSKLPHMIVGEVRNFKKAQLSLTKSLTCCSYPFS